MVKKDSNGDFMTQLGYERSKDVPEEKKYRDDLLILLGCKKIISGKIKKIDREELPEPIEVMVGSGKNIKYIGRGLLKKRFIVERPIYSDHSKPPDYSDWDIVEIRFSIFRFLTLSIARLLRVQSTK